MLKGFKRYCRPLEILTEEQVEEIERWVLDVLEMAGLKFEVESQEALRILKDHQY
jgi:trimethylamine:corrinoid methyltransferase-like protein